MRPGRLRRFWEMINEPPLRGHIGEAPPGVIARMFVQFFLKPHWPSVLFVMLLGGVFGGLSIYFYNWAGRYIADEIVQVQLLTQEAAAPEAQLDPTRPGQRRLFAVEQPPSRDALEQQWTSRPGRSTREKLTLLGGLAIVVLGVHLLDTLGVLLVSERVAHIGQKFRFRMRRLLYDKLHRLPISYHDRHSSGYLMTHLFSDVGRIDNWMLQLLRELPVNLLMIVVGMIVLLVLDARLAVLSLTAIPAYAVVYNWFRVRLRTVNRNLREREGRLNGHIANRIQHFFLVKGFAQEQREGIDFLRQARPILINNIAASVLNAGFVALCGIVTGACVTAVLWLGALRVRDGQMTLGQLLLFYGSTGAMFNPAAALTRLAGLQHKLRATCTKVARVIDEPLDLVDPVDPVPAPRLAPEISFEHVTFRYGSDRPAALDDVSFRLPAGGTLCVMGPSGSGKSTLVRLAARLYDPTQGAVRFEGVDVKRFRLVDLVRIVGFVNQEPLIFDGTIGDNIRYGTENADSNAVVAAARYAQIHDFIRQLPEQYQTLTHERGLTLSGGQKQRVNLARALLYDPRVLVLDDCTSALDAETESLLVQGLGQVLRGRTTIVVSHRISIAMRCTLVMMLEQGRIAEFGPPAELLRNDGPFAAMQRQQASGAFVAAAG